MMHIADNVRYFCFIFVFSDWDIMLTPDSFVLALIIIITISDKTIIMNMVTSLYSATALKFNISIFF